MLRTPIWLEACRPQLTSTFPLLLSQFLSLACSTLESLFFASYDSSWGCCLSNISRRFIRTAPVMLSRCLNRVLLC
ncbi:hypothetical protein BJX70DRAFT_80618 [Aspergillus crustosus]